MIQKHCYECGAELTEKELEGEGIVPYCPQCQQYRFPMYNVAVSMVVTDEETGKDSSDPAVRKADLYSGGWLCEPGRGGGGCCGAGSSGRNRSSCIPHEIQPDPIF